MNRDAKYCVTNRHLISDILRSYSMAIGVVDRANFGLKKYPSHTSLIPHSPNPGSTLYRRKIQKDKKWNEKFVNRRKCYHRKFGNYQWRENKQRSVGQVILVLYSCHIIVVVLAWYPLTIDLLFVSHLLGFCFSCIFQKKKILYQKIETPSEFNLK